MSSILIKDLHPVGHSLFNDAESYLDELSLEDELSISGGFTGFSTGLSFAATVISAAVTIGSLIGVSIAYWRIP